MPHHDKQEPRCQHPHLSWDILFYKAVCPTCGMFFVPRESAPSAGGAIDAGMVKAALSWGCHIGVVESGTFERIAISGTFDLNTVAEYLSARCAKSHEPRITQKELEQAINRLGLDNDLNTPDFRVAEIIFGNVEKWRDSSERGNDGSS